MDNLNPQQSPGMSSNTAAPASNSPEDVMKILSDVEGQFARLRGAQKSQDEMMAQLRSRSDTLQRAEAEAFTIRQDLESRRMAFETERQQFETQRQQLESQRQQFDAKLKHADERLKEKHHELTLLQQQVAQERQGFETQRDEVNRRHAELEGKARELARQQQGFASEQTRITELHKQCQLQQTNFVEQAGRIEHERQELLKRVDQAEANVGELMQQVERANDDLAEKSAQLQVTTADLATVRQRARELEKSMQVATQRIARIERDAAELSRKNDHERTELTGQLEEAAEQLQHMQGARDAALAELDDARSGLAEAQKKALVLDKRGKSLEAELAKLKIELADRERRLQDSNAQLKELSQTISNQRPHLERGAEAIELVKQQQEQLDQLAAELAELKLKSNPEEVTRRDQRIAELTEALRQARGQSAGVSDVAALEQRNAELMVQLDQMRVEVENARVAAQNARPVMGGAAGEQAQTAGSAEQDRQIADLRDENGRLVEQLQQIKAELQQRGSRGKGTTGETKKLRERVAELEQALDLARASAGTDAGDQTEYANKLRENAERIGAVAEHLRRRRDRLARFRTLVRRKLAKGGDGTPSEKMSTDQMFKIEQERSQVAEVRRMLEQNERQMIRRWARPRAAVTVASVFFVALCCAVGSWIAADHFVPAEVSASVALEARSRNREPVTAEEKEAWRDWHLALLADKNFQATLAKRLTERRLDRFLAPGWIASAVKQTTIDTDQPGMLVLTMAGTDEDELTSFLDVLAGTMAGETNRATNRRADNTITVVMDERKVGSHTRYASVNPVAIRDDRLTYAAPAFGASFALCVVLGFAIYGKLMRSNRVFDDQTEPQVFSEARINPA